MLCLTLLYLVEGNGLLLLLPPSTFSLFPSGHCKAKRETVRRDRKRTLISARLWRDREPEGSPAHHQRTHRKRIWSVVHILCWTELRLLGDVVPRLTESVFQIGTGTTYSSIIAGSVERKRKDCSWASRLLSDHFTTVLGVQTGWVMDISCFLEMPLSSLVLSSDLWEEHHSRWLCWALGRQWEKSSNHPRIH